MRQMSVSFLSSIVILGFALMQLTAAAPIVIVDEDYDNLNLGDTLPNWINIPGGGGPLPVVQNVSFRSAPHGAEVNNNSEVERPFPALSGTVIVEVWVDPAGANHTFRLVVGEQGNPRRGGIPFVARSGGQWFYNEGNTSIPFTPDNGPEHFIEIMYDTATATYDLFFDGNLIASAIEQSFSNPINGLAISGVNFNSTGSIYFDDLRVLHEPPVPDTCTLRTDYDSGGCSGTFQASSVADLNDYVDSNFGKNGGANFQNLKIMDDLSATVLDIKSPCKITLANNVVLNGDFVGLDGRKGVIDDNGYTINADTACVLSEQDSAHLGAGSVVNADNLTVQGDKTAKVGQSSMVTLTESLTLTSTGNFSSSDAIVRSGSTVTAETITISASRGAHLGENTVTNADTITISSTGNAAGSDAGLKAGAEVVGEDLMISASREAKVGQNTTVTLSGHLLVDSTGTASGSVAIVRSGAEVSVGNDMSLTSGNRATIGQNATVDVTGNLDMDAASLSQCTVRGSATVSFGSKSGSCAPLLP